MSHLKFGLSAKLSAYFITDLVDVKCFCVQAYSNDLTSSQTNPPANLMIGTFSSFVGVFRSLAHVEKKTNKRLGSSTT